MTFKKHNKHKKILKINLQFKIKVIIITENISKVLVKM